MSLLWKIGIIGFLVLLIFGGGSFAAYELFFKKPANKVSAGNQAVVTPTPDPGPSLLSEAQQLMAKGDSEQGKQLLISIFQNFPASTKAAEAKKIVGNLNIRQFFSDANPTKTNYVGSSRWIVLNTGNITIYSETNPTSPNAQKPKSGIEISADEMEELYSLVGKDSPVTIR